MDTLIVDRTLFNRIADGDESAFRECFHAYTPKLKAFFMKLVRNPSEVPELVQETFLNLWLYRAGLKSVENPSAYLYKIAANVSVAWFRRADINRQLVAGLEEQQEQASGSELLSLRELQHHIDNAVNRLPLQQQSVFRLSREQGLSRSAIAAQMGIAEKTVRNHLTLALQSIQQYLKEHHHLYLPLVLLQFLLYR